MLSIIRKIPKEQQGFTLIEVLASVGILLLLAAIMIENLFIASFSIQKNTALNLAKEEMEEIKSWSWQEIQNHIGTWENTIDNLGYPPYKKHVELTYYQGKASVVQIKVLISWNTSIYKNGQKGEEPVYLQLATLLSEFDCRGEE